MLFVYFEQCDDTSYAVHPQRSVNILLWLEVLLWMFDSDVFVYVARPLRTVFTQLASTLLTVMLISELLRTSDALETLLW